jgi:hypothetical protein
MWARYEILAIEGSADTFTELAPIILLGSSGVDFGRRIVETPKKGVVGENAATHNGWHTRCAIIRALLAISHNGTEFIGIILQMIVVLLRGTGVVASNVCVVLRLTFRRVE